MNSNSTFRSTARAFAARGRWYSDGPDFIDVPCAHCRHLVESVDARGECDDCSADELRAAVREVAIVDQRVALTLGAFAFARREAALAERELGADEGFAAWCADAQLAGVEAHALEVDRAARREGTRYWSPREAEGLMAAVRAARAVA